MTRHFIPFPRSAVTRPTISPPGLRRSLGNGTLTVTNSYVHDNEDGILTGGPDAASPGGVMSVVIRHSQISDNGAPPGSSYAASGSDHNIYAGSLTSFALTDSYVTNEQGYGHEVKSRALSNIISNNRIQDGPTALVSYSIDLSGGGNDRVIDNVIEKGPRAVNHAFIHFGGEGTYPSSNLFVSGNTFINDGSGATGVLNQTVDPNSGDPNFGASIPATITDNTFYDVSDASLFQDDNAPPFDNASNNLVLSASAAALDTSPRFATPRTLVWIGSNGMAFDVASNWNDLTDSLYPAQTAPNSFDTVEFNANEGAISGKGTVSIVDVGSVGAGVLELNAGATLLAGTLEVGMRAADVGQVGLTGIGTELIVTGPATVADDGTGVLSVLSGATFAAASLTIGSQGDSSGAVVVSGAGSVINLSGALNVGTALGTGDLTIGPGAAVHASVINLEGQVVLEGGLLDPTVNLIGQGQTAGGFGTISAGDIIDEGVIQAGGTKPSQKLLIVQGTVVGGGTLTINGTVQRSNSAGVLQINPGGTLELTGPVLNAATTTFTDNLTPTGTYTVNNSVIDVTFADAAGVLQLDSIAGFGGTISTYHAGDAFVITGGTLSNLGVNNGTTLTVHDSGTGAGTGGTDNIVFGSAIDPATLSIVNGNTIAACFAAGMRIATVTGPVAVEALAVGDRVLTAGGADEPIVWIGSRVVNCKRHPAPETVWPVRVAFGVFGENVPVRDLFLSPDHAVFVNGVLVPVKLLINGTSIVQVKREKITYYHVELPAHDVILAEGLAVESYLDVGDRANFHENETLRLFPHFAARLAPETATGWETRGAAPLVTTGDALAAARATIVSDLPRGKLSPVRDGSATLSRRDLA
jgi:T5SS/PEP-CTERM-associated repeat protein